MSESLAARVTALEQRLDRLDRRGRMQFALGRTTMEAEDGGTVQTVQTQLDALTTRDGVPVLYHYGFGSSPPIGTDVHIAFLEGERSKAVIIASGNKTARLTGHAAGDVWMAGHGFSIVVKSTGIEILGDVKLTGNLHVTGEVKAGFGGGDQVGLQTHTHSGGAPPTAGT